MIVFGYRVMHALGFRPWEAAALRHDVSRILAAEFDQVQARAQPPFGTALDLGCGTGLHTVELARRGWQVTGVDIVPKAIRLAARRARAANVDARFLEGDITALPAEVGTGYRLILDFGAFHGLTDPQRHTMGQQVDRVAAADATLLMVAFEPGRHGLLPRGAAPADITAAIPGWTIIDDVPLLKWPASVLHLYRLRRTGNTQ
jgi:SAM-dependent methyltransferase